MQAVNRDVWHVAGCCHLPGLDEQGHMLRATYPKIMGTTSAPSYIMPGIQTVGFRQGEVKMANGKDVNEFCQEVFIFGKKLLFNQNSIMKLVIPEHCLLTR